MSLEIVMVARGILTVFFILITIYEDEATELLYSLYVDNQQAHVYYAIMHSCA